MPPFLELVQQAFGTKDLYGVLGLDKGAKEADVRKAYYRLSLKVHPDRVEKDDVDEATAKFQVLGQIYGILSNKDRRALYDDTGTVDEDDDSMFTQDRDWVDYWRSLFKRVSVEDIKTFEVEYKGSGEEEKDLKAAYTSCKGDMDLILDEVMCATLEDEPRFRALIEQWIREGLLPALKAFTEETEKKRKRWRKRREREAEEAERARENTSNDDSLSALIKAKQKSRQEQMDVLFDSLEEKYASKKPKRSQASSSRAAGKRRK